MNKIYSNKNKIYSNKNKIYRNTHVNIQKSTMCFNLVSFSKYLLFRFGGCTPRL